MHSELVLDGRLRECRRLYHLDRRVNHGPWTVLVFDAVGPVQEVIP